MKKKNKRLLSFIIIAVLVFLGIKFLGGSGSGPIGTSAKSFNMKSVLINTEISDWKGGLVLDELGGYIKLSPDNKYLAFIGLEVIGQNRDEDTLYIANLETDEVTRLEGVPTNDWDVDEIFVTSTIEDVIINNLKTGEAHNIEEPELVTHGHVSPDNKLYVFNTESGIRMIDLQDKTIEDISGSEFDGAFAWFDDSEKLLGFVTDNSSRTSNNEPGRSLAIWNVKNKSVEILEDIEMPNNEINIIDWLVPEKIARVNTGEGRQTAEYLVNLDTKEVTEIGDTGFLGGVKIDRDLGLLAVYGPTTDDKGSYVSIYNSDGKREKKFVFDDRMVRGDFNILDDNRLLYLKRTKNFEPGINTEVVLFNFSDESETVLIPIPTWVYNIEVSDDKKSFIVPLAKGFFAKEI